MLEGVTVDSMNVLCVLFEERRYQALLALHPSYTSYRVVHDR